MLFEFIPQQNRTFIRQFDTGSEKTERKIAFRNVTQCTTLNCAISGVLQFAALLIRQARVKFEGF